MKMRTVAAALAAALALGCQDVASIESRVNLTVAALEYGPSDLIYHTLFNGTGEELTFGMCDQHVERFSSGVWVRTKPAPDVCLLALIVVGPQKARSAELSASELGAGTFRLVQFYWVNESSPRRTALSQPFTVRASQ